MPRLVENFEPLMVRNSEETTSVGRFRVPNTPGSPPLSPAPFWPSSRLGQISEWKTMLSLPMK